MSGPCTGTSSPAGRPGWRTECSVYTQSEPAGLGGHTVTATGIGIIYSVLVHYIAEGDFN